MLNPRFIVIALLGFSSGLPFALIGTTLQAWFSDQQAPLAVIGLLSVVNLPYAIRWLWSIGFDKHAVLNIGLRKGWMCLFQLGLLVGLLLMSLYAPNEHPCVLIGLALLVAVLAASQDTVVDAHRIDYLATSDFSTGATVALTAYRLAMMVSGSIALIAADHFGWQHTYQIMAILMSIGLITSLTSHEPTSNHSAKNIHMLDAIKCLVSNTDFIILLGFIFFFKSAEAFTSITSPIMQPFLLNEMHFSLTEIGLISKGVGLIATIAGGVFAGFIMARCPLYKALMFFGLAQALTNFPYIIMSFNEKSLMLLSISVIGDNLANGMGITGLYTFFMRLVDKPYAATQMSLLVSFSTVPLVFSGPVAAWLVMSFGWLTLLVSSFLIAFGFIPFLLRLEKHPLPTGL